MTREEAQAIVDAVTFQVSQPAPYPPSLAVKLEDARRLIGDDAFARLEKDRIRFHGWPAGTVYPWNVVDYLQFPDLGLPKEPTKKTRIV